MLCGQSLIPFHFITSDPLIQETVTDSSRNCRFFTRCTGQNFSNQLILFFCCQYFVLIFMSKCFWTTSIFCTNPNPNCIMKSFFIYSLWCFWPFSLAVQFHTLFLVFITIFHKNAPNTGCPVLGVHIIFAYCSVCTRNSISGAFNLFSNHAFQFLRDRCTICNTIIPEVRNAFTLLNGQITVDQKQSVGGYFQLFA